MREAGKTSEAEIGPGKRAREAATAVSARPLCRRGPANVLLADFKIGSVGFRINPSTLMCDRRDGHASGASAGIEDQLAPAAVFQQQMLHERQGLFEGVHLCVR